MKMEIAEKEPGAESKDGGQEELSRPGRKMVLNASFGIFEGLNQNSLFTTCKIQNELVAFKKLTPLCYKDSPGK